MAKANEVINNALKISATATLLTVIAVGIMLVLIFGKSVDRTESTITVSGEKTITVAPEQVEILFQTREEGKDISALQNTNADKITNLKAALNSSGIAYEIETISFNIYPEYDWTSGRQVFRTNVLSQTVKITSKEIPSAGKLVDMGINAQIGIVQAVSFTLTDATREKQNNVAQSEAIKAAKEKARIMAESGGFRLKKVVSVSTGGYGGYPIYRSYDAMAFSESAPKAAGTDIQPQNLEITASASITYGIA